MLSTMGGTISLLQACTSLLQERCVSHVTSCPCVPSHPAVSLFLPHRSNLNPLHDLWRRALPCSLSPAWLCSLMHYAHAWPDCTAILCYLFVAGLLVPLLPGVGAHSHLMEASLSAIMSGAQNAGKTPFPAQRTASKGIRGHGDTQCTYISLRSQDSQSGQ